MGQVICMRSIVWQKAKAMPLKAVDELQKIWQLIGQTGAILLLSSASLCFAEKNHSLSFWGENENYDDAFVSSSFKSNDATASLKFVS